jgi:hypothetical protein
MPKNHRVRMTYTRTFDGFVKANGDDQARSIAVQRAQAEADDGLEDGDLEVTEVEQVADDD